MTPQELLERVRPAAPPAEPVLPAAAPEAPEPAGEGAGRRCASCDALLQPEQEWCLDCGTAVGARRGRRPHWAIAAGVVTGVLAAAGAATAATVGSLGARADQTASAPAAIVAQAPVTGGQPAPVEHTPVSAAQEAQLKAAAQAAAAQQAAAAAAAQAAVPPAAPATPPTTTTPPSLLPPPPTDLDPAPVPSQPLHPVELASVANFDPYAAKGETGASDPAVLTDGDRQTVWSTPAFGPDSHPRALGIVLDAGKDVSAKYLEVHTPEGGWHAEIYGCSGQGGPYPPSLTQDPEHRWFHLATTDEVTQNDNLPVKAGEDAYRYYLIWFTKGSPGPRPGPIEISELSLLR